MLLALMLVAIAPAAAAGFVDDAGRTVEVPDRVGRVMAAGPPASVLLYSLAPDRMVGWIRTPSADEKAYLAAATHDMPAHGRLAGRGGTANLETVLKLKPDLIIDVGTVDATYASLADRVQEQRGIPYVLIDGRFARTPETLRKVARLIGVAERGEALAGYAEKRLADVARILAKVPEANRPRVYYGRGPEGLETGLAGSINTEILEAAGAVNVAAQAGAGGIANVSVEQVLAWNPDIVITLDPAFQDAIKDSPLWAPLKAVREGRVYRTPTLPYGWFDAPPGVNRLIGVAWLLSLLYPQHTDIDLRAETRQFYKLFYQVALTDAQIDTLLAQTGAQSR